MHNLLIPKKEMLRGHQMRDTEKVAAYLSGLSYLEDKTSQLYNTLSDKVKHPHAKALLLYIAFDSLKHSAIMKSIATDMANLQFKPKDYKKIMGSTWETIERLSQKMQKTKEITPKTLLSTMDELLTVYAITRIQFQTLQAMAEPISQRYGVDIQEIKDILELTIMDQQTDTEVLTSIKNIFLKDENGEDGTPAVKYQTPDRWYVSGLGKMNQF